MRIALVAPLAEAVQPSQGPVLIKAIEDRAQRQREQLQAVATTAYRTLYDFANSPDMLAAAKAVNQFAAHPAWEELRRQIEAASKSPMMQQIKAFANSPELKRMNELMNSRRPADCETLWLSQTTRN